MTAVLRCVLYIFTLSHMDARSIIASLLSCGSLDAGFLIHIFDTYSISLPEILDEIEMAY